MYTNEQIDKWTAEAGIDTRGDGIRDDGTSSIYYEAWPEQLTRFAALVAQHERERCQAVCEAISLDLTNDVHVRLGAAKCHAAILRAALADLRTLEAFDCAAAIRNSDGG